MTLTDPELKAYSLEHIGYEIKMLVSISNQNARGISDQFLVNLLVESFAIHSRNLIDFLYPTSVRPSDIVAYQFGTAETVWEEARPPISPILEAARVRAHKEVSHLTTERINGTPEYKKWDTGPIVKEIAELFKLLASVADKAKFDISIIDSFTGSI